MDTRVSQTETVFVGRKFNVVRHTVDIGGIPHTFDVAQHPGAAVILPVLDDGRILLIENYRVALGRELLELPAGTIDGDEPAETCAHRELAEETGYRAGRLEHLATSYSSPGILDERMESFLATALTPGAAAPESGEQIRLAPMTLGQALDAVRTGRIVDGKTILTLLYYDRFVRGQEGGR